MATLNITNIPAPRVPFIDERTGLMAREWYRFFLNLFVLTGSGNNPITLEELQLGPPSQQDCTEIIAQVANNLAPQYEDQSGDFLATLDTAQLMSMMARFENLEAAIQGAYLNPPQIPATGGEVVGPSSSTDNAIARFDGTSGKVIQNSVTTIDDTGNASGILSQQFSDGTAVTLAAGKMWYDGATGAWNAGMGNGNITQQIGEEIFVYGKASAAITDSPLQIIYHTGVVGASGAITFAPTIAGITDVNAIIGVATESLALNGFGRATVFGVVHGITTNGTAFGEVWADDDVIWYNPVTGNPTKVEPVAPYIKVQVGLVIKAGAGGSGSFQVNIARGSKLGGTDSNVQFGALANNNLIAYDSAAGYWKNVTASAIGLGTVTSVAALTLGTTGTDLSSTVANGTTTPVITLQVPTASATNRGALSAADWTTFNSKGSGSVTSVAQSFTGGLISVAGSPITTSGTLALTVAGTSGGIPYFSSASTWATSAALAASALVVGGGAGAAPATITTGTGVTTALGVNTGTAGAFVVNGGALGTPSSGTVTNLTGTASININGTVGATTATTGKFTTITTSSTINSLTVGLGGGSVAGNTVLGTSAFVSNVTGGYSVAIGTQALQVSTAGYNTAVGNISQQLTSTGQSNVSMGYGSLAANTSGGSNTAIGTFALYVNTGSTNSTAVGYQAGIASTGSSNQFFGNSSGSSVTSGAQNVILGGYTGAAAPISATGSNYVVLSDGVGNVRGYWNGADATFNGALNTTGSISKNSTVIRGTLNIGRSSTTIAASTTNYLSTRSGEATEALGQMVISSATTLRNLYVATSTTQGALGSLVITIRKNGVATALTVTIAAGTAAGVFSDTTHSVTFAAGDLLSAQAVNNDLVNVSAIIQSVSVAQDIG